MDESPNGFLDNTSISKTPRSPLLASTAARNNKRHRNYDLKGARNSCTVMDATALNEITNTGKIKYKFNKTLDSVATEANSSLGILHMDNMSDFTDASFMMPQNIKSKEDVPIKESNALNSSADPESSSDVEYDGTNIPELNFECDIGVLTGEAGIIQESNCNLSSEKISDLLQSLNIENKTSAEAQESIFSSLEPNYQELFNEDKNHATYSDVPVDSKSSVVCSTLQQNQLEEKSFLQSLQNLSSSQTFEPTHQEVFKKHENGASNNYVAVDFKSSVVDTILEKDPLEEEAFLQNIQKLSSSGMVSVSFCPEEISARSSSFRSPSDKMVSFSQTESKDSPFPNTDEGLKDEIISGSRLSKHTANGELQDGNCDILRNSNGASGISDFTPASSSHGSLVPDKDSIWIERETELDLDSKLRAANFSSSSNLLSSSYYGFSDSEFVKSVRDILKEDMEAYEEEKMFEISSLSKSSNPQLESSAASWTVELQSSRLPEENHQVSIGALLGARSENVGTLSEDSHRERPYFGTQVSTPTKDFPNVSRSSDYLEKSAINSVSTISAIPYPDNSCVSNNFCDDSGLTEILEDASTLDPSRLFSRILKKHNPVQKSTSSPEERSHLESINEVHNSVSESLTHIQSDNSTIQNSPTESNRSSTIPLNSYTEASDHNPLNIESDNSTIQNSSTESNHFSNIPLNSYTEAADHNPLNIESDNSTIQNSPTESNHSSTIPLNSSYTEAANHNPLSITRSEAGSDGGLKTDMKTSCINCQNAASSTRPSSSCSNCSSIPPPNYAATQNFLASSNNFFHNGMLYNAAAYRAVQPSVMAFYPPLHSGHPGYSPYNLQGSNHVNAVIGPEELQYPEKFSLGAAKQLKLQIQNAWNVPCSYRVTPVAATLNHDSIPINFSGVSFPKIVNCNNDGTSEIEVILTPKYEGKFRVELLVASYNLSECTSIMPLKTVIKYEVVRPVIKIWSKGKNYLDIGPCLAGSTVIEHVTVENASEVTVPLHLTLTSDWEGHQISFCENQTNPQRDMKFLTPKLLFYQIPGSYPGSSQAFRSDVAIKLVAGNHPNHSFNKDLHFELLARIESESVNDVLASFKISASVGIARLVLCDPSQNPLRFQVQEGIVLKKPLTVKNEGCLHVKYDLFIEDETNSFSVFPSTLSLQPSETSKVFITFSSSVVRKFYSPLVAAAQPQGQVIKVADVYGYVSPRNSLARIPELQAGCRRTSYHECKNIVETNKKLLAWGGVDLGISVMKSFTLRNVLNRPLHLKLFIKEASQSFQLLNQKNETSQSLIFDLQPREEKPVSVIFAPNTANLFSGILGMKPTNENGKMLYSIPLSGYGGLGKLKILDVPEKEGIGYCLELIVTNGRLAFYNINLQNTGARAIFVKIILSGCGAANYIERIAVNPSEFVLLENENKAIQISCTFSANIETWNVSHLGLMTLLYGDEIMRQQLQRYELNRGQFEVLGIELVEFTSHFEGEERVSYDFTCQASPKDAPLFVSNLKKTLIHLNPVNSNYSYSTNFEALSVIESSYAALGLSASSFSGRPTTFHGAHSPPEKQVALGKPCPPQFFPANQSKPEDQSADEENKADHWIVKPEELCLDSSCRDRRIAITNFMKHDMKFRVECPVDVISISPLSGIVPTKGEIGLRCRIIPNSMDKISENGDHFIRIICGSSEKTVHVKVTPDSTRRKDMTRVSLNAQKGNASQNKRSILDGYASSSNDATLVVLTIESILDFPKEITLPTAEPGDTSKICLTFQNTTKSSMHWKIIATSCVFPLSLENTFNGDIFMIHPSSGALNPMEKCTITASFFPVALNTYSQFFEFCTESVENTKEKCNFKISGKGSLYASSSTEESKSTHSSKSSIKGTKKAQKSETGICLDSNVCQFQSISAGQTAQAYVTLKNFSGVDIPVSIIKPKPPFSMRESSVTVRSKKYLKIPVMFKPTFPVQHYEDEVVFQPENYNNLVVQVKGYCF